MPHGTPRAMVPADSIASIPVRISSRSSWPWQSMLAAAKASPKPVCAAAAWLGFRSKPARGLPRAPIRGRPGRRFETPQTAGGRRPRRWSARPRRSRRALSTTIPPPSLEECNPDGSNRQRYRGGVPPCALTSSGAEGGVPSASYTTPFRGWAPLAHDTTRQRSCSSSGCWSSAAARLPVHTLGNSSGPSTPVRNDTAAVLRRMQPR